MKTIISISFAVLVSALQLGAHAALPAPVLQALRAQGIATSAVSAIAKPLNNENLLVDWQSAAPRQPASVMKLVSTYAALSQLGSDYRWNTPVFIDKPIEGDVLKGPLYIRGAGDPRIVIENLVEWMQTWRKAGLRVIEGDLVIDESLFESISASSDPFDGDPSQPYNVMPYPLLMNFKATKMVIKPLENGKTEVVLDPPLAGAIIDNQIVLRREACVNRANKVVVQDLGSSIIRVTGPYSSGCAEGENYVAVFEHKRFIHAFFKAAWESVGGVFNGRVVTGRVQGKEWSVWRSPRNLGEIVTDINKFSSNVMTRQILMQMGHETFKQPATEDRARKAVFAVLEKAGLAFADIRLDNGSGLSRGEQISVRSLVLILTSASKSRFESVYRESLPVVGVDGTMAKRLTQSGVAGQAWIKTGSIDSVSSIAGFVHAKSGRRYAVAFIVNSAQAHKSFAAQDQFLQWVYDNG